MQFLPFSAFEIKNQEEFDEGKFAGADILLKMTGYDKCLVGAGSDDEEVNDMYFFIEDTGLLVDEINNLVLYELEEKMFVLFDDFGEGNYIIIRSKDSHIIEEMFKEE